MRVCIYSIDSRNFGNKLQNYALQTVLRKCGHSVKTVTHQKASVFQSLKHAVRNFFTYDSFANYCKFRKYIDWEYHYISPTHIPQALNQKYDFFVIGSDQIWNPTFPFSSQLDYLPFVDREKCVSYAASIGISEIPEEYREMMTEGLTHIARISVREDSGARIVHELTNRDAEVHIDPTLLLSPQEWSAAAKKPKGASDAPFILTYFLSPKCNEAKKKLDEIRGARTVYELKNPSDSVCRNAGPSEFLWLFEHADLVLTDSFHACVFSFLYNKPFLVYDRNWKEGNMNSRIETLLSKFHLERKYAGSGIENDIWEHNYEKGYRILEYERANAITFLKEALTK